MSARIDQYRAIIHNGRLDHIIDRVDILCSDENEARELAKRAADVNAVELWKAGRFIERFES